MKLQQKEIKRNRAYRGMTTGRHKHDILKWRSDQHEIGYSECTYYRLCSWSRIKSRPDHPPHLADWGYGGRSESGPISILPVDK
jgi:hypothetical protein